MPKTSVVTSQLLSLGAPAGFRAADECGRARPRSATRITILRLPTRPGSPALGFLRAHPDHRRARRDRTRGGRLGRAPRTGGRRRRSNRGRIGRSGHRHRGSVLPRGRERRHRRPLLRHPRHLSVHRSPHRTDPADPAHEGPAALVRPRLPAAGLVGAAVHGSCHVHPTRPPRATDPAETPDRRREDGQRHGAVRRTPGTLQLRGGAQLGRHGARGRGGQRAAHGAVVVPGRRPSAGQGADGHPRHRPPRPAGGLQRPSPRGTPDRPPRDVPLGRRRPDGDVPGVLRGRPVRDPTGHGAPSSLLPRGLAPPRRGAAGQRRDRPPEDARDRALAAASARSLPLPVHRRRRHRARPGVLSGEPDPSRVPARRLAAADGPRAGPSVVRRLGLGPALGGRVAERGFRDVHGAPLDRGTRRPDHLALAARGLRLDAGELRVLGPRGRRPGGSGPLRLARCTSAGR